MPYSAAPTERTGGWPRLKSIWPQAFGVPGIDIRFRKLSDQQHSVSILRRDGSRDVARLDTRSFLRHDLAHYAVERELPIAKGYWGSVAAGASLDGAGIEGPDAELAESLAGPVQTLMRTEAGTDDYLAVLARVTPGAASAELASRIQESIRRLRGYWRATPFGGDMYLDWPDESAGAGPQA